MSEGTGRPEYHSQVVPTGDLGRREAGAVGGREVPRERGSEGFFAEDELHSPLQPLFPTGFT